MNLIIGSHVGFNAKTQLLGSVEEALSYNANTFMIYTGSTQSTLRSKIDPLITEKAWKLMEENNIKKEDIIVHAPYIINLGNIFRTGKPDDLVNDPEVRRLYLGENFSF